MVGSNTARDVQRDTTDKHAALRRVIAARAVEVSAVIPCLNEERTLGLCIAKAKRAFESLGIAGEVVVGDNGSTDRSVQIAKAMGARIVHQPVRGYGAAVTAAAKAARGRYIVMADADDSYDWSRVEPFIAALKDGADMVVGNRFRGGIEPGAMPALHRYFGNPLLSGVARLFFGVPLGDFHCGMRGFTREAFERMDLRTTGMEFATEMIVRARRADLRIAEIPIPLHADKRDRPPHLRSFRDGWRHLRYILAQAPNYTYLVPGVLALSIGVPGLALLAQGPVTMGTLYMGPHFLALFSMLALVGFNIVALGLLAKVAIAIQMPFAEDRVVRWLQRRFNLEAPLLVGGLSALAGLAVDGALLWRWVSEPGAMEQTVHLAFLATTTVTLGLSIVFTAFLMKLLLECERHNGSVGG